MVEDALKYTGSDKECLFEVGDPLILECTVAFGDKYHDFAVASDDIVRFSQKEGALRGIDLECQDKVLILFAGDTELGAAEGHFECLGRGEFPKGCFGFGGKCLIGRIELVAVLFLGAIVSKFGREPDIFITEVYDIGEGSIVDIIHELFQLLRFDLFHGVIVAKNKSECV